MPPGLLFLASLATNDERAKGYAQAFEERAKRTVRPQLCCQLWTASALTSRYPQGKAALHVAARHGVDVVEILLANGADLDATDEVRSMDR